MILFDYKLFLGVRSFSVKNIYAGKKKNGITCFAPGTIPFSILKEKYLS